MKPRTERKFGVVLSMRKRGAWPALAEPVRVDETQDRMRAQSILCGMKYRDGSTQADTLTIEQARDVLRWARMPIM